MKISLPYGWKSHVYTQKQIATVTPIDEDKYRSAGGAAAGAIIGGVLTGGIGLLAGAAFGGRRKQRSSYLVTIDDGHHVAFEEDEKDKLKPLNHLVQSSKVKSLIPVRDNHTTAEGVKVIEALPVIKLVVDEQAIVSKVVNRPPDQPVKIRTEKGSLVFWGLVTSVFGMTFIIFLDDGVGVALLLAVTFVLPLFATGVALSLTRRIYRWVKKS